MERGKAAECRKHGWTQAANDHEQKVQQLEYEIWAETLTTASFDPPQPKAPAPVPVASQSSDATATPPTTAYPSSGAAPQPQGHRLSVTEGTSWPPQQQVAPVSPSPIPSPPPPAYSDIYPDAKAPH